MRFVLPTTYARSRIFRPRREAIPLESFASADVSPVCVTTSDGLRLNGWYAMSRTERDGVRPLVLYLPGAAGHRGYRRTEIDLFTRMGCDLLLVDYRGYGDNDGRPSERGLTRDARAIWQFAATKLGVPPRRIVVFGESIGGGVAVRMVSGLCRAGTPPAGLILQATFASMLDVVSQFFPRALARVFLIDRFPSERRIRSVTCPLLAIHGAQDRLIPVEMGRRLFASAPPVADNGQPRSFVELPGVDHNDIYEEAGIYLESRLKHFLEQVLPQQSAEPAGTLTRSVVQPSHEL
jgi:uncharacterized protein